jgi:hypothetical protein
MSKDNATGSNQPKGSTRRRLTRDESEAGKWLSYILDTPAGFAEPTRSQRQRAPLLQSTPKGRGDRARQDEPAHIGL